MPPASFRSGLPVFAVLLLFLQTVPTQSPDSPVAVAKLPPGLGTPATYPPAVERVLKNIGTGIRNCLDGNYPAALAELPESGGVIAIGDYVSLYRGKANLQLDRADEALASFRAVQSAHPDSPVAAQAVTGEAEALLKMHKADAALQVLQNAKGVQASEILYLTGLAGEETGNTDQALAAYRQIYTGYVNSKAAGLAEHKLRAISPKSFMGAAGYRLSVQRAESLIGVGRNREARALLARLAKAQPPDRPTAEKRLILMGEADYALGKGKPVLTYLKGVKGSDAASRARLTYLKAILYRRTDDEASFLAMRDEALRLNDISPWTEKLLLSVATYYDVNGDLARAQDTYRTLREKFPAGQYAERALWKTAFYSYVLRRYEESLRSFWDYVGTYPDSGPPGAPVFWMARCYENIGDTATAAFLYGRVEKISNLGYYGTLAGKARRSLESSGIAAGRPFAGIDLGLLIQTVDRIRVGRGTITPPGPSAIRVLERASQLSEAGLPDLAVSELKSGIERFPEEKSISYVLARQYEAKGDYFNVILTLRRAFPDYAERPKSSLPDELWDLLFPMPHREVIAAQAARNNLDPNLVLGLIRQESAFHEDARSSANARGLMQVLPSTGRILARDAGVTRYNARKLIRPDANIALGTRYLASLLQRFDGKVELALAAYNAGENRAQKWRSDFGAVDGAEFVERIPFSETRAYVKQVLANSFHYAALWAESGNSGQ